MELRHLRYFVAIAAEQNIRRAAQRLYIAQPALSRQMRQLEEELECSLFDRLPRGVRLNTAGKAFLESAVEILARADEAVEETRRAAKGESGRLHLGYMESAAWSGIFPRSIQEYKRLYPGVHLQVESMLSIAQIEAVAGGALDGGFCYVFEALPEGCEGTPLRMDRSVLAVPKSYGWEKRRDLRLKDLEGEMFVGISSSSNPAYAARLVTAAAAGGLSLQFVQEVADEPTLLSLVSAGIGMGFCNAANAGRKPQFVDLVPVVDLEIILPLHFVGRRFNSAPTFTAFRSLVRRKSRPASTPA